MTKYIKGWPIIGNLLAYQKDKIGFLNKMKKENGETYQLKFGNKKLTVVLNPADVYHVMHTNMANYPKKYNIDKFFGDGVFTSNGELWKDTRRKLAPFFKSQYVNTQLKDINDLSNEYFENLSITDSELDIRDHYNKLAFNIILTILIGKDFLKHSNKLIQSLEFITTHLLSTNYLSSLKFLQKKKEKLYKENEDYVDKIVYNAIDLGIKERSQKNDLLSFLLKSFDYNLDDAKKKFVRDQIVTLFFAGYETTSVALSWFTTEISKHPEVQERIFNELNQVDLYDPENVNSCVYTDMVIKECMRLYPPGWAWTRYALKDDQLSNHKVNEGDILLIVPFINHRDPNVWENPNEFQPERFSKENELDITKGSYLPFSLGPRACSGMSMAMWEMRIITKAILQRYILSPSRTPPIIAPQTSLQSANGFKIKIKKR